MNKPKNIGTKTESAFVTYAKANGFPDARRIVMKGRLDEGDVELCKGLVVEVKGGHAAERASDNQVIAWLGELEREVAHYSATTDARAEGILVLKRAGVGYARAGDWWAIENYSIHQGWIVPAWRRVKDVLAEFLEDGYGQ